MGVHLGEHGDVPQPAQTPMETTVKGGWGREPGLLTGADDDAVALAADASKLYVRCHVSSRLRYEQYASGRVVR